MQFKLIYTVDLLMYEKHLLKIIINIYVVRSIYIIYS